MTVFVILLGLSSLGPLSIPWCGYPPLFDQFRLGLKRDETRLQWDLSELGCYPQLSVQVVLCCGFMCFPDREVVVQGTMKQNWQISIHVYM